MKPFLIIAVIIVGLLGGWFFLKPAVSPDILYLTGPINGFSGTIEKIEKDALIVSRKANIISYQPDASSKTPINSTTLKYKALITPETTFTKSLQPTTFTASPSAALTLTDKLTFKDLKVGQTVNIGTSKDLRTVTNRQIDANNITLITSSLGGKIIKIEGNILTVRGIDTNPAFMNQTLTIQDFLVEVISDNLSKLKVGDEVMVYHDLTAEDNKIKATSISIQPTVSSPSTNETPLIPTPTQ